MNRSWGRKRVSPPSIRWGCFHSLSPQLQPLRPRASKFLEERGAKYILHASPFTPSFKLWLKSTLQQLHLMFHIVKCLINVTCLDLTSSVPPEELRTCNYLHIGDIFGRQRTSKLTGDLRWLRVSASLSYISCLSILETVVSWKPQLILYSSCLASPETLFGSASISLLPLPKNTKAYRISLQK